MNVDMCWRRVDACARCWMFGWLANLKIVVYQVSRTPVRNLLPFNGSLFKCPVQPENNTQPDENRIKTMPIDTSVRLLPAVALKNGSILLKAATQILPSYCQITASYCHMSAINCHQPRLGGSVHKQTHTTRKTQSQHTHQADMEYGVWALLPCMVHFPTPLQSSC